MFLKAIDTLRECHSVVNVKINPIIYTSIVRRNILLTLHVPIVILNGGLWT